MNRNAIKEAGIEAFVYKESALQLFSATGWKVKVENSCTARVLPTPASVIFEGARADSLPVAPTELEFCTIHADSNRAENLIK